LVSDLNVPDEVTSDQDEFHYWVNRGKNSDPETELNGNGWFIKAIFRIFMKGGGTKPIIHPLKSGGENK